MSSARYAPLPNPRSAPDADREMHEAFQLDDEDDEHSETSPLAPSPTDHRPRQPPSQHPTISIPSEPPAYDFERDYDYDRPPLGSPPSPSAVARPNNYGNTNGVLPSAVWRPDPPRPSFFRRIAGVLLPQHYQRVPDEATAQHPVGGGTMNDGVFANVVAKPGRMVQAQREDGSVYMVPEETQNQAPPSYNEAQADAVPPYWETTVHAPSSLNSNGDMIVDDLPTGNWYLFFANVFISYFFQFIGFLFTYLLHNTHAAKYGSRVGLGMTLIHYGFYSRRVANEEEREINNVSLNGTMTGEMKPHTHPVLMWNGTIVDVPDVEGYDFSSRDWISFLLMTLGWFLLLSSLAGFYRVKRWEASIRAGSSRATVTTATPTSATLGGLWPDFHAYRGQREDGEREHGERDEDEAHHNPIGEAEARLAENLRAAGLI